MSINKHAILYRDPDTVCRSIVVPICKFFTVTIFKGCRFRIVLHAGGSGLRVNDGAGVSWLGFDALFLVGPAGVQLFDFCCSSVRSCR